MDDGPGAHWCPYPLEVDEHPGRDAVGDDGGAVLMPEAKVIGLGAVCGLRPQRTGADGQTQSFWVAEFAKLRTAAAWYCTRAVVSRLAGVEVVLAARSVRRSPADCTRRRRNR